MERRTRTGFLVAVLVLMFLAGNRFGVLYGIAEGGIIEKAGYALSREYLTLSLEDNVAYTSWETALYGAFLAVAVVAWYLYEITFRRNTREGEEQGSARWGGVDEGRRYSDRRSARGNIILSSRVRLALSNAVFGTNYKFHTNKNVLVVGGSGSGKSRFYVLPNLLQAHSCYILTDPKGTSMPVAAGYLQQEGYRIYSFNTIDLSRSMGFDPFHYVKTEQDVLRTADNIILNTKRPGMHSGEQFWEDGERMLYVAIMSMVVFYAEYEEERTFNMFLDLFAMLQVVEDRDEKTALDFLFEDLEEEHPGNFASMTYLNFKKAYPQTASGIIISACARLMPFYIPALRRLFEKDELDLDRIGFEKTAHFLVIDDTDSTFDFAIGLLYSTMLTILIRGADRSENQRLPVHTRIIMDEAANIARVRNIEKVTAQVRSRGISIDMLYQNAQQLKALYKEMASVIEGNFDTMLFLGSEEPEMGKIISEKIGDQTVAYQTSSMNRGRDASFSSTGHVSKRRLLAPEEVRRLPSDECIVFMKGLPPIRDRKYAPERHPAYRMTGEHDRGNLFSLPLKADEPEAVPVLEGCREEGNTLYMEFSFEAG
jgi:type IV secretion system protein VirD4